MPKYIRQLEEKRLIDTEPTKVKTKAGLVRNGNLRYTIRPIQEAMEYKLERDLVALPDPKSAKQALLALCEPIVGEFMEIRWNKLRRQTSLSP